MNTLQLAVDELFHDVFPHLQFKQKLAWVPKVDIQESSEGFILFADAPGLSDQDVKIEFHDGILTISGERKDNETALPVYKKERAYGKFERSFNFGNLIAEDSIVAKMQHGVLEVKLPKKEVKKPKLIQVEVGK